MYLIQQADLVVDNKFRNNHVPKCTTSTTTMKQEETYDFTGKNGLNGNSNVASTSSLPHSPTIASDQVPVSSTVSVVPEATSSSDRSVELQVSSSHGVASNSNNALHLVHNNNYNSNYKKSSNIENGAKPNNNSNNRTKPASITGERLQFFKDGKFILELARAREGDKTGWVSVPRKSYWPPTVSSSTSANFKKNESSGSLSCSDDNSSVQSSPWQREHCWKKTIPRKNISKDLVMFYHRPSKIIKLTKDCVKAAKLKHRRPFDKREAKVTFIERKRTISVQCENKSINKSIMKSEEINTNNEEEGRDCTDGSLKMEIECTNKKDAINTFNTNVKKEKVHNANIVLSKPNVQEDREKKLNVIIKQLCNRANSGLSRLNHIKTSHQQHVSPRKRILREFEKVSLEDIQIIQKRSRAKTGVFDGHLLESKSSPVVKQERSKSPQIGVDQQFNNKITNGSNNTNQLLDTHTVTSSGTSSIPVLLYPQQKPTSSCFPQNTSSAQAVSQSRISSYSITSLLGHESSSSTSFAVYKHMRNETNSRATTSIDISNSRLSPLCTDNRYSSTGKTSNCNKKGSPSYGTSSPLNNVANNLQTPDYYTVMRSPDLSPSPEHQIHPSGFTRFLSSSSYNMTHGSSSSPHSTGQTASSPSPSNSDSYTTKYKSSYISESPNHHPYATISPSHRYSPINGYQCRNSPLMLSKSTIQSPTRGATTNRQNTTGISSPTLSPTIEETGKATNEVLPFPIVRNLPKKFAALRQQAISSPPSSSINPISVKGHSFQKGHEKEQRETEHRIYSPAIHSNIPSVESLGTLPVHAPYPAAAASMYQYMFPPGVPHHSTYSSFSSYYQQAYAAAVFRNPLWMHYPATMVGPSHLSVPEHLGAPHSSWPISEHSASSRSSSHLIEDAMFAKDEQKELNPDVPLNLSKH